MLVDVVFFWQDMRQAKKKISKFKAAIKESRGNL